MQYGQITKSVIDFQKTSFDSWFSAISLVQDQAVSTMGMMLDQAAWLPEDGRNAIQRWVSVYKDERNRLKSYVELSFTAMEQSFIEAGKSFEKTTQAAAQP